ncbi:hypothetical protein [Leptolyngbya sp. O-77]|uniref:hypothetical protein n=1 Tax=Leptolyngbya sp. O-77 TaxID=1080068 RepID=UPI00074D425A|nr:hypothetical protein [Leptolyngbya sp. O-77]BAU41875.1 hypothetical protein O77CONTIG1_01693 [Leptolyngbya sp. O-77]
MISKPGARVIGYGWRRWVRAIALLFLVGLLTGCSATAASGPESSGVHTTTLQNSSHLPSAPSSSFGTSTPLPVEVAARIKTTLAEKTGLSTAQMTLSNVSPQTWNNACLGAAEPDEVCAEVMTPGYRVTVSTPQGKYHVHTDQSGSRVRVE